MFKRALMITTSAAALTLAATAAPVQAAWINDVLNRDVAKVREMKTGGTDFSAYLAEEYRKLALFEADEMYDFPSSDYFAEKALAVKAGQDEIPAVPQLWDVDSITLNELADGREKLTAAFHQNAKTLAPRQAAVAQAKYDCWVEQMAEGYDLPWQAADIADCKAGFLSAMSELDRAIVAARPAPAPVAQTPAAPPQMSYVATDDRATVYFDFDKSAVTPTAQATIDRMVEQFREGKDIVLTVEGHTDRAGPAT